MVVLPSWFPIPVFISTVILIPMFLYGFFYSEHRLQKSQYLIISFIFLIAGLLPINEKYIVIMFLFASLIISIIGIILKNLSLSFNSIILLGGSFGYFIQLFF
ncbi:MAG: hypothetical protein M9962_13850 [Oligoflexia bacterium]|nr:hypothetical protein [Oligoflexia bacterium]